MTVSRANRGVDQRDIGGVGAPSIGRVCHEDMARAQYPDRIRVVELVGNVGSYNAIVAGIAHASGDCMAVITADMQDPPELMVQMYAHWLKGFKLVIGNRQDPGGNWLGKEIRRNISPG